MHHHPDAGHADATSPKALPADERRLAGRVASAWREEAALVPVPRLGAVARSETAVATNAVLLDLRGPAIVVASVCAALAGRFELQAGVILSGAADSLAMLLGETCVAMRTGGQPLPFEGSVAGGGSACLLVRGVLLPMFDGADALSHACAVVSWKEVLDGTATALVRRELGRTLGRYGLAGRIADPFAPGARPCPEAVGPA